MKYNVAQTVIDIIEADDPDSALEEFNRRLANAGFEIYGEETTPGAILSETQED